MTDDELPPSAPAPDPETDPDPEPAPDAKAADSRRWRSIWRTHFYAGIFSAPILLMFAVTGLIILYTQPIQSVSQDHLRNVRDRGEWVSFDKQEAAVAAANPTSTLTLLIVPRDATSSTEFLLDDGTRSVFVDPYTAKVLGSADPYGGIVGFSNRMHGFLNNESVTVKLPNIAGPLSGGPVMQEFVVGDMILEVFACWSIVLVCSGLYLWWPRRSKASGRGGKSLVVPRLSKKGRARWRDLHAIPGMLLAAGSLFVLTTGLFWSSYWAASYNALAEKVTPSSALEQPDSTLAKRGDLDRLARPINWNTGGATIPNSSDSKVDPTDLPARVSLDLLVQAADDEGMKPGYYIVYPADGEDDAGNPTYGSFSLSNSWPRKTSEARDVYIDQFSGKTLGHMDIYGYGGVTIASDTLVSTHMGTQLGIFSRILMTLICLAIIWSVISAVVMYSKRRRPGSLGLPRRPVDVRLARGLLVILVVLGIVYPLWGVTALLVLAFDRFVVRKVPRLRTAFGQR